MLRKGALAASSGQPPLHFISSKGLLHARHQYVLTEAWDPNALMSSVSTPSQNGHTGASGSTAGASSRRSAAS